MIEQKSPNFTRYERARIIGARALQIAMNASLLIKLSKEDLEKINYDVLKIAEMELDSGILPISVNKPLPQMKRGELKRQKKKNLSEKEIAKLEESEQKEIEVEGEIMKLAEPDDEDFEEEPEEL
jgi:DNA-directed RNA polymerase subunit K